MFAGQLTRNGTPNPAYESIERIKNEYVSIAASDIDHADRIRITKGQIQMNEYYGQDERLVAFPRITASFVTKIKKEECKPKAEFNITFMVGKTGYVLDRDGVETDKYQITGMVPQFAGKESLALLVFALIIIAYTFSGGFKAVCWTDFFQGLMMLVALMAVPIVILMTKELDVEALNFMGTDGIMNTFGTNPFDAAPQDIISGLAWGLGYFGMPHILVRFMSIKKASLIKKSATVAIVWVILSLGAAIVIAYLGRMLHPELIAAGTQETIFIVLVRELFPTFVAGILLSAILAAAMSTADSQLLVASSSFTSDIYKPVFRKNASEKEELWVGRAVVIVLAIVAYFIASNPNAGSIMSLVENAWAGFGAAFGPVIILSLFWKRFTYKGAIAGIIGGGATVIVWIALGLSAAEKTGVYELLPGFIVCLVLAVAVSLIDKAPSDDVVAIFENATSQTAEE
jgi:sodium/proline symporter